MKNIYRSIKVQSVYSFLYFISVKGQLKRLAGEFLEKEFTPEQFLRHRSCYFSQMDQDELFEAFINNKVYYLLFVMQLFRKCRYLATYWVGAKEGRS